MATAVQIVLQEAVQHLGESGDVVRVKPGYARNYLIPRGLGAPATAGNLARIEELKARAQERAAKQVVEARALKTKLESVSIKIGRQVGAENKMFGSVTGRDIEEAFAETHGLKFDRRKLKLEEAVRTLGLTEVQLELYPSVVAVLRVEVVKQAD